MKTYLAGIGTSVPPKILDNAYFETIIDTSDEWIRTRSGIRERHVVEGTTATSDLALDASRKALAQANIEPKDIEAIIVATATPDMYFPSTACVLQNKLGARNIMSFDIAAGCTGFLYAVGVVDTFIKSGYDNVLMLGAECLTKITDYTDRSSCFLFGDAAGAVVFKKTEEDRGILSSYFASDGSYGDLLNMPAGGSLRPASHETVDQHLHTIRMLGNEVFKVAVRAMGESALKALERANVAPEQVDLLVPHQANIRIIEATAKRLHIPMDKVAVNIDRYGNTSAASIPLALDEAIQKGRVKQGDLVLMVAFGAGFTWSGVLMRL
ncbi:ketoacyl-ACP synthase III [candidate division WOR-3 bacterium]|nr:ketoacyl-ACP synthase III [candidate division WOR-3 bacterium]